MSLANEQESHAMRRICMALALLLGVSYLISFGIIGIGRGSTEPFADVRYWYLAAKILSEGGNPYDFAVFLKTSHLLGFGHIERYAYPPHSFVLVSTIAYFTIGTAKIIWTTANVLLLVSLIVLNQRLLSEREIEASYAPSVISTAFIALAMLASPFSANVIWIGQMTFVVSAALVLGWRLLASDQPFMAGALLGFATIKPQLSIFFIVWLVATRNYRALVGASIAVITLSVPALLVLGSATPHHWLLSLGSYQAAAPIALGLSYNTDIKSLLTAFGFQMPSSSTWILTALGALITIALSRLTLRGWLDSRDALPLLICISLLLVFGRDYDLGAIFPVLPAMCWHLRGRPVAQSIGVLLMVIMYLPHRWVSSLGIDSLLCWRIIFLIAITAWLAKLSIASPHGAPNRLVAHPAS